MTTSLKSSEARFSPTAVLLFWNRRGASTPRKRALAMGMLHGDAMEWSVRRLSEDEEEAPRPKPVEKRRPVADRRALIAKAVKRAQQGIDGRLPYFLHLHKAGGTTVCHVARMSNELNAAKRNCNAPGDGPRTLSTAPFGYANKKLDGHCKLRRQEALKRQVDFLAVERWLDTRTFASCHTSFFFVTVLREPVQRIVSHCRFEHISAREALAWTRLPSVAAGAAGTPIQRGAAVVDNFYVRSLLGGDVYEKTPPGQITAAHASQAIEVLSDFDAVLILENLDRGFDQLFHRLGWCRPNNAELRQSFGPGDETIHFSAEDRRALARHVHFRLQEDGDLGEEGALGGFDDLDAVGRAHAAEEGHRRAVEVVGGRDAVERVERLVRLDLLRLDVPRLTPVRGEVEVGGAARRHCRALVRPRRDERPRRPRK